MKALKYIFTLLVICNSCSIQAQREENTKAKTHTQTEELRIELGAERTDLYFPIIRNKRVAIMSNQTGMIGDKHLVDVLVKNKFDITGVFAPEHGFRGNIERGISVESSVDEKTGIPILSLYSGKTGKPSKKSMDSFDILIVDLQDVGVRFYTYYVSMFRLMDACAEHGKKMIVLDRPNPVGQLVDGPILDMKHKSGVGWLALPAIHGMTMGELALMINGENWLPKSQQCELEVIACEGYTRQMFYELPIAPSPNLPNMQAIYLYPSTCLFEGTTVTEGRGTDYPFQVYGHPKMKDTEFTFTPRSIEGARNPEFQDQVCYGVDLRNISRDEIIKNGFNVGYIIDAYNKMNKPKDFFTPFFEKIAGVDYIREMIIAGKSADEIKAMWKDDVAKFRIQRAPYLIYEDK